MHLVRDGDNRIIPAYAGSTAKCVPWRGTSKDHPRIRGEHAPALREILGRHGSSPHTRGARESLEAAPLRDGIIPAYAGSTR